MTKQDALQHAEAFQHASSSALMRAQRNEIGDDWRHMKTIGDMCLFIADGYRAIAREIEE